MNIIVTANQTPFVTGGAVNHQNGLVAALRAAGHHVELVRFPFQFQPEASVRRLMDFCERLDFSQPNGQRVDRVISLQFPGYAVGHPRHLVWIMHQFRAVYELYDERTATPELRDLRADILTFDERVLERAHHRFANSRRVAERLSEYNGLDAEPLAHPPAMAEHFRSADPQPYIFCPSRLESLKRQDLLIEAARHLHSPIAILIAGTGGQLERYADLIRRYRLQERVRLLGHISEAEKLAFYAHALGVFFAPFDEDYGYITLEAMLSSKPVLTCTDSGGPLEFVVDGETGWVLPPEPAAIAEAIEQLYALPDKGGAMGRAGRAHYDSQRLCWSATVERLLAV